MKRSSLLVLVAVIVACVAMAAAASPDPLSVKKLPYCPYKGDCNHTAYASAYEFFGKCMGEHQGVLCPCTGEYIQHLRDLNCARVCYSYLQSDCCQSVEGSCCC